MKLATALAAASLAAPPLAAASQVVKTVTIAGSDAGGCKFFDDAGPGCDANFVVQAREFADGSVEGGITDVLSNGPDAKGNALLRGTAECVEVFEDASGAIFGVVAGTLDTSDEGEFEQGDTWWTYAFINGEGTPWYTTWIPFDGPPTEICDNAVEFVKEDILEFKIYFKHMKGQVAIDKFACEDLRSKKKCGRLSPQCKWEDEEKVCVENLTDNDIACVCPCPPGCGGL